MFTLTEEQWAEIESAADEMKGSSSMYMYLVGEHLKKIGMVVPSKKFSEELISKKMGEAKDILLSLGIDDDHLNKMCILTFLALCKISPDTPWSSASKDSMSMSKDIMKFVSDNYNLAYKSNTRESFRRDGINLLLSHGLIDLNPDNPHLGPNSPLTHYAIKNKVTEKIKLNGKVG